MPLFPMFVDLKGKPVLLIGGGKVALRKLEKLMPFEVHATVIAPKICDEIQRLPFVTLNKRSFENSDLDGCPSLVIAATDDTAVNAYVSTLCKERNIPVNVADAPELCTFQFPAIVQKGSFCAGISTGGASPTAAAHFKFMLESQLPDNLDEMLDWLAKQRDVLKETVSDQKQRSAALRGLFFSCLDKGGIPERYEMQSATGHVALVGAGCGKADLITLWGLRLLQQCQAVVYDDLIDPVLLDAVPESAIKLYMGKRSGAHSAKQSEINEKLIELAKAGLRVVRLKGGDPYLFGRGGEEILALKEAGIPFEEVPGIPSAIGIPAEAGIPVTHRGASRGLHIVTAHTSDTHDGLPEDFDTLAQLSGTLVFLMGLSQLSKIVSRLIRAGKSLNTPAAVLSGGNAPNPCTVRATLKDIVQAVETAKVTAPAIILVGEVAELNLLET